jgi:hypothetical protein
VASLLSDVQKTIGGLNVKKKELHINFHVRCVLRTDLDYDVIRYGVSAEESGRLLWRDMPTPYAELSVDGKLPGATSWFGERQKHFFTEHLGKDHAPHDVQNSRYTIRATGFQDKDAGIGRAEETQVEETRIGGRDRDACNQEGEVT